MPKFESKKQLKMIQIITQKYGKLNQNNREMYLKNCNTFETKCERPVKIHVEERHLSIKIVASP